MKIDLGLPKTQRKKMQVKTRKRLQRQDSFIFGPDTKGRTSTEFFIVSFGFIWQLSPKTLQNNINDAYQLASVKATVAANHRRRLCKKLFHKLSKEAAKDAKDKETKGTHNLRND